MLDPTKTTLINSIISCDQDLGKLTKLKKMRIESGYKISNKIK